MSCMTSSKHTKTTTMVKAMALELAIGSWRAAAQSWPIDKTLSSLFGAQALAYQHIAVNGLDEGTLADLASINDDINARLKFREECN